LRGWAQVLRDHGAQHVEVGGPIERALAGQQLPQHDAEREHIRGLGISVQALKSRLHRARAKLRDHVLADADPS